MLPPSRLTGRTSLPRWRSAAKVRAPTHTHIHTHHNHHHLTSHLFLPPYTWLRTLVTATVTEKCSGNHNPETDVDTLVGDYYAIDCGPGYVLKAGHAGITADGLDFDAKRTQCCDAISGMCSGNAEMATDLGSAAANVAPFGIACGFGYALKTGHEAILADGADFAAKQAQCCDGKGARDLRAASQSFARLKHVRPPPARPPAHLPTHSRVVACFLRGVLL